MKPEQLGIDTWDWNVEAFDPTQGRILLIREMLDIDLLADLVTARRPFALLHVSPLATPSNLARSASMLRDKFSSFTEIVFPILGSGWLPLLRAAQKDGFRSFAFTPTVGGLDVVGRVNFMGRPTFREEDWYHLAYGRAPGPIEAPGLWTWSEETI